MRGEIHRAGRIGEHLPGATTSPSDRPISTGPVTYPPVICRGMHHAGRSPALSLPGFSGTSWAYTGRSAARCPHGASVKRQNLQLACDATSCNNVRRARSDRGMKYAARGCARIGAWITTMPMSGSTSSGGFWTS